MNATCFSNGPGRVSESPTCVRSRVGKSNMEVLGHQFGVALELGTIWSGPVTWSAQRHGHAAVGFYYTGAKETRENAQAGQGPVRVIT